MARSAKTAKTSADIDNEDSLDPAIAEKSMHSQEDEDADYTPSGIDDFDDDNSDEPAPTERSIRKPRRLGLDGKPMRRIVLVVSDVDRDHIITAITTRIGPVFARAYGATKIDAKGPEDEYLGRALAAICEAWLIGIE